MRNDPSFKSATPATTSTSTNYDNHYARAAKSRVPVTVHKTEHLTHEVLTTFLAEVTAIMNARPLVPVSSDPESPFILTPATLLTQKTGVLPPPHGDFNEKDLLRQQWRRVQSLANSFWNRWRKEYLSTLQSRRKWHSTRPNLQQGDVVLLKDPLANEINGLWVLLKRFTLVQMDL
ncbi:hypothetical protein WMY93_028677 [Mugilogobius chulae]|uniref:DUF5641 domain-containing protein n=1 Tax=Mugilogobius chulae TaxID=88201 RepID=A0AAW0MP55_9GOBI